MGFLVVSLGGFFLVFIFGFLDFLGGSFGGIFGGIFFPSPALGRLLSQLFLSMNISKGI